MWCCHSNPPPTPTAGSLVHFFLYFLSSWTPCSRHRGHYKRSRSPPPLSVQGKSLSAQRTIRKPKFPVPEAVSPDTSAVKQVSIIAGSPLERELRTHANTHTHTHTHTHTRTLCSINHNLSDSHVSLCVDLCGVVGACARNLHPPVDGHTCLPSRSVRPSRLSFTQSHTHTHSLSLISCVFVCVCVCCLVTGCTHG